MTTFPYKANYKSDRIEIEQEGTGAVLAVVDHSGVKVPTVNATNAVVGALTVSGATNLQNLIVSGTLASNIHLETPLTLSWTCASTDHCPNTAGTLVKEGNIMHLYINPMTAVSNGTTTAPAYITAPAASVPVTDLPSTHNVDSCAMVYVDTLNVLGYVRVNMDGSIQVATGLRITAAPAYVSWDSALGLFFGWKCPLCVSWKI